MNTKELTSAIKAGYAFFYCQTFEIQRAFSEILTDLQGLEGYQVAVWDFAKTPDIDATIQAFDQAPAKTILIAKNLNWFLADSNGDFDKQWVSMFQSRSPDYSSAQGRKVLIVISDSDFVDAIPSPLQKEFFPLSFDLPGLSEIKEQYNFIVESAKASRPDFTPPDGQTEEDILLSCRGMTAQEIQNALAFSLVENQGIIDPKTIAKIRASGIEKIPGVKIGRSDQGFDALKGYGNIKVFAKATVRHSLAKGILLLGSARHRKNPFLPMPWL